MSAADIDALRHVIEAFFPRLWLPTEAVLASALAMMNADVVNPPTCIFTGAASSSKTTVLDFFDNIAEITYRSDRFTPKAFVSHAANVPQQHLAKIDLLPRVKHRVLITPELAPMFRQKEEGLRDQFSVLTAVLDGHGYTGDSGTQGRRGYTGDYLFTWIGATTPLPMHVWRVMAQLGSRLLFYEMPGGEVTDAELDEALSGVPYRDKLRACASCVSRFLSRRFCEYGGVRGVKWDAEANPLPVLKTIKGLARLLALCRSSLSADDRFDGTSGTPADAEQPFRAQATLYNLARGRAMAHGRQHLIEEDLPLVAHVTLSSMPHERSRLLRALIRGQGWLTTKQVARVLGVSRPTARLKMGDLARLGIATLKDRDQFARLSLRPDWRWCLDLATVDHTHTSSQLSG
jgi:hypothetical protein